MTNQNKSPVWNTFPTQWIWVFILGSEFLFFILLKWAIGAPAYFLLGPLIVYNLSIYLFPYLYFFLNPPASTYNRFAIDWLSSLQTFFPIKTKIHFFLLQESQSPLFVFAHRSTLWILASEEFLMRFSPTEANMIQAQIFHLWQSGHLANATTWTALQKTLPLWFVRNPRGKELMFVAPDEHFSHPSEWRKLCLKVFHWMSHQKDTASPAMSPSLFFPTLTNYSEKSYSSLYQYLQNELIESLKEGDPSHEPAKSGSLIFNSDPFHRLDGSNGPGFSPPPSDRQN